MKSCGMRRRDSSRSGSTIAAAAASSSSTSRVGSRRGWADLPDAILHSVLCRLPSIPSLVACSAVCRSWRALAVTDSSLPPLLLRPLVPPGHRFRRAQLRAGWQLLDPADPAASYLCAASPESLSLTFVSYSRGSLILHRLGCTLIVDIFTGDEVRLPDMPCKLNILSGLLTAPLSSSNSNLLVWSSRALFQWQVGSGRWTEHQLGTGIPSIKHMVAVKGEVFALDPFERLLVIHLAGSVKVRQLEMRRPWIKPTPFTYGSWLVELDGELLLARFAVAEAMLWLDVEVFRLDLSEQAAWVKVDSLGDWALFICPHRHNPGLACKNPGRWGGRSNCVYYARSGNSTWNAFPLGAMSIDTTDPECSIFSDQPHGRWPSPIWVYPSKFA